jgi:hypothetical protein
MIRVVQVANRQVGDGAAADDAIVLLPEAPPGTAARTLVEGVVVHLANGLLLGSAEGGEDLDMPQGRQRSGHDDVVA